MEEESSARSASLRRRRCGPGLLDVDDEDEDEEDDDDGEQAVVAVDVDVGAAAAIAWEGNPGRRWVARVLSRRSACPRIGSSVV